MATFKPSGMSTDITVDGTHERFKGTKYEDADFMVQMDTGFGTVVAASIKANKEAKTYLSKDDEMFNGIVNALVDSKYRVVCAIKDWDGFGDYNGADLPCTEENVMMYFKDPAYEEFFAILRLIILDGKKKTEEEEAIDEGLGEQETTSDGSSVLREESLA